MIVITSVLTNGNIAKSGGVIAERADADSCVLGPGCANSHGAFTDGCISIASRVAEERPVAECIVEAGSGVAIEGLKAKRVVVDSSGVAKQRLRTGGCVVVAAYAVDGCVAGQR